VLAPAGRLHFVTDVADYQQRVAELVAAHTSLQSLPAPEPDSPTHDMDYLTSFERKFRKEGRPIYRLLWSRPESPAG
jgi:tRNA (guanine-N7-)-methyltransferase